MAYSAAWSEAIPLGSLSAADIDQAIRDAKRDIRERVAGVFGMADWSADPLVIQNVAIGALPAQSGSVRVANNVGAVVARNALNTADFVLSKLNAANVVEIANAKITVDPTSGDITMVGTTTFSAINVKFINNAALSWRNAANTQDIFALSVDVTDTVRVGADADAAGIIIGQNTKKLGFFSVAGVVQQTVTGAKGGNAALTSLMAALGGAGYGLVNDTTT